MRSNEFVTEWKNVKADPKMSPIRKQVSRDINKVIKQFGLRRKWGEWTGPQLSIQFWQREAGKDGRTASKDYTKLMAQAARQLRKIPNVAKVTHNKNLLNYPDLIIKIEF